MSARLLLSAGVALACVGRLAGAPATATDLRVVDLRCEYSVNPLGVDTAHPRLSWQLTSATRGQRQTASRLLVASSRSLLDADRGDLWDSGEVASSETIAVPYGGVPLTSSLQVFWKVRAWDAAGRPSPWSEPAAWTMGVLAREEWKGGWITASGASETMKLRREFTVGPGLRRAIAHVSGLGQYEMSLNGARVGVDLFAPGWTGYDKTVLYDTHDVTSQLVEGPNAVGLRLGNGMYHVVRRHRFAKFTGSFGPLRAILHLRLEYANGRVEFVGTDDRWRTHAGAETFATIYGGEDHDARLETPGWDHPGFDDRAWRRAVPVILVTGQLVGHRAGFEPVREVERRVPSARRTFADGTAVYDFGQNASFLPRITVSGPAGSTVRLTPAEVVNADGTIHRGTMGGPHRGSSWWQYTKATDGIETWTSRFYYLGSRYLKAELIAAGDDEPRPPGTIARDRLPTLDSIESIVVHSTATPVGHFRSSSARLNQIRDLVRWSQRSNMVSVLTDCPHREKLGWIEQFHLNGPSLRYEFDLSRTFTKAMWDMADAQLADGLVPNIAPEYVVFEGPYRNAAEWGAAFILVPWQQYLFTGDADLLRAHYDAMTRYFAFLDARTKNGLLSDGLGDWYDFELGKEGRANLTPAPNTATAYLYEDARVLSRIADVLGRVGDAARFREKADAIRARYVQEFYRPASGTYGTGSQASLAIPLALGIVEPSHRAGVLEALVRDVEWRGYATAGDVGFRSLLRALAENGRSDVIYGFVDQDEKPGYAYQIRKGGTTLAEAWDANLGVSQNHFILGQVIEWLYRDLAGIDYDEQRPGFRHVVIRPAPVGDLAWVEATYGSVRGPISVRWERDASTFRLDVEIPANTTATVVLPTAGTSASVQEGGMAVERVDGVSVLRRDTDRVVLEVTSGRYAFAVREAHIQVAHAAGD